MSKIVPLEIVKPKSNDDAISQAKDLVARLESGELNEFIYVGFLPDGSYDIVQTGLLNTKEKIGLLFQIMRSVDDSSKKG